MRGLAFIGGEAPVRALCQRLAAEADVIAAADSGLLCAEDAGIRPDWIVGDMDSLGDLSLLDKYPPERVLRYPADKDFTDTELALNLLFGKGCAEVTLAGGGGGRLDHTLAIAALFEREDAPSRWFTAHEEIVLVVPVNGAFRQRAGAGSVVSVFPIGAGPWKAASTGLKWPLDAVRWRRGYSGVSNIALADSISVTALAGRFLLVMGATMPRH